MEQLAPNRNLQRYSIRQIEELFPELHGWGQSIDLNDSGLPGSPIAAWLLKNGMLESIGLSSSDYALLALYWQLFFFTDPTTPKTTVTVADVIADPNTNTPGGNVFYSATRNIIAIYGPSPDEFLERRLWRYMFSSRFEIMTDNGATMYDNGQPIYEVINA